MARKEDEAVEVALAPPFSLPASTGVSTIPEPPRSEPTDGDLLLRIGNGDRSAFEVLYRRYARAVLGLALRRLGDRGRAEEAVQETFTSIWRSASSYRPERGPGAPWLYAVARHAIVDRFRARAEPPAEVPEEASTDPGPAERAEASFVSWRVHRALEELPQNERTVIELAYWGGLSQSEVSEYLSVPLGTVKTRTRSGLRRLADLLEGELG
jgi:RNA polymerase sigma-70 factor (ECF subfamily)